MATGSTESALQPMNPNNPIPITSARIGNSSKQMCCHPLRTLSRLRLLTDQDSHIASAVTVPASRPSATVAVTNSNPTTPEATMMLRASKDCRW